MPRRRADALSDEDTQGEFCCAGALWGSVTGRVLPICPWPGVVLGGATCSCLGWRAGTVRRGFLLCSSLVESMRSNAASRVHSFGGLDTLLFAAKFSAQSQHYSIWPVVTAALSDPMVLLSDKDISFDWLADHLKKIPLETVQ